MHEEPIIKKKKKIFPFLKTQYVYSGIIIFILILGVAYSLNFFLESKEGIAGGLTSDLVTIEATEEGTIFLENTVPMSDEAGLEGSSKTLTIKNTSNTNVNLKVKLKSDDGNTIPTTSMRYGLYLNNVLKKVDYVGPTDIIYEGLLMKDETVALQIYLWIDYYYNQENTTFSGSFEVNAESSDMLATEYVSRLVDKDKGLYKINDTEYRYSGLDVDNYIWFNCQNNATSGSDKCELWRIVGSFNLKANQYAESYQRLKIVKDESLASQTFGTNNIYSSSTINTYLNDTYYNTLSDSAKKMIVASEWKVGATTLTSTPSTSLTNEKRTTYSTNVGLLSASDFGYSTSTTYQGSALNNSTLYTNSWLKGNSYYTLTPISGATTTVVGNSGSAITSSTVTTASGVKPCVYLSPSVSIVAGDGTIDKPYELSYIDDVEHYSNAEVVGKLTYNVNGQDAAAPSSQVILAGESVTINGELESNENYKFIGWATTADGDVVYQKGDTLTATGDVTLYAKWKTLHNYLAKLSSSDTAFWSTTIESVKASISKVKFVNLEQSTIDERYDSASIKEDVTDTSSGGSVKAWLETDSSDSSKYIMYVASEGTTYFPSQPNYMFGSFTSLKEVVYENVNTKNIASTYYMFNGCTSLTSVDLSSWDASNITIVHGMFYGCTSLKNLDLSSWNATKITKVQLMFYGCTNLISVDLSGIKSTALTQANEMFYNCSAITSVNLSNAQLSTSSNVNLYQMFRGCSKLKSIDIRSMKFTKVNGYYNMFYSVPADVEIIVLNSTQKTWITGKFSTLTNIVTVS